MMKALVNKFRQNSIASERDFSILIAGLLAYLWGLNDAPVKWLGDQKTYLNIALEMMGRSLSPADWGIPYLFGEPNFLKPPFQYWMTLVSWKILGMNFFATYFPSVLAALGTGYLVVEMDRELREMKVKTVKQAAFSPGYLFVATLGAWIYSHVAQMEIWLSLGVAAIALLGLRRRYFSTFILIGVLAWVKSPLYSVLATLSLFVWISADSKRIRDFKSWRVWAALLVGTGVGLSWFGYAYFKEPVRFWDQYILYETFGKRGGNGGSWLLILRGIFVDLFPATLALFGLRKLPKVDRTRVQFVLAWTLPFLVFFVIHPYRLATYAYVAAPFFCLLLCELPLGLLARAYSVGAALVLLVVALVSGFFPELHLYLGLSIAILVLIVSTEWFSRDRDPHTGVVFLLLSLALLQGVTTGLQARDLRDFRALIRERQFERIALHDPSRNIWNERAYLALALQLPVDRIGKGEGVPPSIPVLSQSGEQGECRGSPVRRLKPSFKLLREAARESSWRKVWRELHADSPLLYRVDCLLFSLR